MTRTQADTYVKDYIDSMKAMEFEIDAEFELVEDDTVPGYVYEEDVACELVEDYEDVACELVKDYISDWINEEDVEDDTDLIAFLTELK